MFSTLVENFQDNEPLFDHPLLFPAPSESEIAHFEDDRLLQGTIESAVCHLTSPGSIDYQFLVDFFLSYREFIEPLPLLELLLCRLTWALKRANNISPLDDSTQAPPMGQAFYSAILVRTFVMLRHWLLNHFPDFVKDRRLRQLLCGALNEIARRDEFRGEPDSLCTKVIVDLKKLYARMCSTYWDTGDVVDGLADKVNAHENARNMRVSALGLQQLGDKNVRRSQILSVVEGSGADPEETAILHPKASLNCLVSQSPVYDEILGDVKATPIQGVRKLSQLMDLEDKENGFCLNGKVDVFTESKVDRITPTTPLKKLVEPNSKPTHGQRKTRKLFHLFGKPETTRAKTVVSEIPLLRADNVDLLSSRVITEFGYYQEQAQSRRSIPKAAAGHPARDSSELFNAEVYDESPTKGKEKRTADDTEEILNAINHSNGSFRTPSVSINWSSFADGTVMEADVERVLEHEAQPSETSAKSYLSYDSDLSSHHSRQSSGHHMLRKKLSFSNLRKQEQETEENAEEAEERDSETPQIDDVSSRPTLYFYELPFFGTSLPHEDDFEYETETASIILSGSHNLPYPGISQNAIAELAAIPDEKYTDNPVNHALLKLRGQRPAAEPQVVYGLNDEHSQESDSSLDEVKLERKVRDLFIQPAATKTEQKAPTPYRFSVARRSVASHVSKFTLQSLSNTPSKSLAVPSGLSVEEIMYKGTHVPFILGYESHVIAKQLTLIERDFLLEIDWHELIDLKWDKPLKPYNSWLRLLFDEQSKTGLRLITLRFNLATNWIISEILLCKSVALRALTLSRFIHVANNCLKMQNYSTVYQIVLALNSSIVKKLKSTWKTMDVGDLLLFKKLKDLCSPERNFANFRAELRQIRASKGIIPFLALDLSDLTVNSERPTTTVEEYELINIDKFRVSCGILKNMLRNIEYSKIYSFQKHPQLLSKCLYISCLSEEEMDYCYSHLEE
ncbi:hypothetical protein KL930_000710 [Ogataea haglerorum]|nr:hypothetical protein KL950_000136 [Ogataea haglerorum]KAG7745599.1 hypothetical protein KL932_000629 [Ogataea haglerorum]KAG7781484.1 hypothetical protein KL922_000406 [Ogataea haglerorum]KAG7782248.1 hypothetical protein KL930_000710 [Ogataea haglerorum]